MRKDESAKILSDDWKELIVEDAKTKEKLVIINSDGVEITSSDLNVRLVPKARINPDELLVFISIPPDLIIQEVRKEITLCHPQNQHLEQKS